MYLKHVLASAVMRARRKQECYVSIHQNQASGHQDQEMKTLHGRKKTKERVGAATHHKSRAGSLPDDHRPASQTGNIRPPLFLVYWMAAASHISQFSPQLSHRVQLAWKLPHQGMLYSMLTLSTCRG